MSNKGYASSLVQSGFQMARKNMENWLFVLIMLFLVSCAGCSDSATVEPDGTKEFANPTCILNTSVCKPPCWEGISPGSSTKYDVLTVLETSSFCLSDTIIEQIGTEQKSDIRWQDSGTMLQGEDYLTEVGYGHMIQLHNDVVDFMQLFVNPNQCNLPVSKVIELYGTPELILSFPTDGPIIRWNELDLVYPEQGVILAIRADYPPSPDAQVGAVWYFEPEPIDEFLQDAEWSPWVEKGRVEWWGTEIES